MNIVTGALIVYLLILIGILVGLVFLQLRLSKAERRWPGLILPVISFIYSLIMALAVFFYSIPNNQSIPVTALVLFLECNIPTAIFLAIYFSCRKKLKTRDRINHMNIQDL